MYTKQSTLHRVPSLVTLSPVSAARRFPAERENPRNTWAFRWALQDLNLRPTDYESAALTN